MHALLPYEATAAIAGSATVITGTSVLAVAALSPQSQVFGKTVVAGNDPTEFALTFDDGPNERDTDALLELLGERRVRASFFMIGRFVREQPEIARRVVAEGHLVGNHTVTHPWLAWQNAARVRQELTVCSRILEDTLGVEVNHFRPPHGARRPLVLRVAAELDMRVVQWNVMGQDWRPIGTEGILRNVRRGMARVARHGRGANILLHDGGDRAMGADRSATVGAVRTLLDEAAARGMHAVTVDAW